MNTGQLSIAFSIFIVLYVGAGIKLSAQHCQAFQLIDSLSIISGEYNKRHINVRHASFDVYNGNIAITLDSRHWLSINLNAKSIDATMPFDTLVHDEMNYLYHDSLEPNKLYITKSRSVTHNDRTYHWDFTHTDTYSVYSVHTTPKYQYTMYRPFSQNVILYHYQSPESGGHGIGGGAPFLYRKNLDTNEWDFYPVVSAIDTVFETEAQAAFLNIQNGFHIYNADEHEFIVPYTIHHWDKPNLYFYCLAIAKVQDGLIHGHRQMLGSCSKMPVKNSIKLADNVTIYPMDQLIYFSRGDSLGIYDKRADTLKLLGVHEQDGKIVAFHVGEEYIYTVFEVEHKVGGKQVYAYHFVQTNLHSMALSSSCQVRADGRKRWYAFDRSNGHLLDVYNHGLRLNFDYYSIE